MRWFALGVLTCLLCVASVAHASTGTQGPSSKRDYVAPAPKAARAGLAGQLPRNLRAQSQTSRLILDEPVTSRTPTSPTIESIKSLANGDSLLNPWVPGRGTVGVNVKVTW